MSKGRALPVITLPKMVREAGFDWRHDYRVDGLTRFFGVPAIIEIDGLRFTSASPENAGEAESINKAVREFVRSAEKHLWDYPFRR